MFLTGGPARGYPGSAGSRPPPQPPLTPFATVAVPTPQAGLRRQQSFVLRNRLSDHLARMVSTKIKCSTSPGDQSFCKQVILCSCAHNVALSQWCHNVSCNVSVEFRRFDRLPQFDCFAMCRNVFCFVAMSQWCFRFGENLESSCSNLGRFRPREVWEVACIVHFH